MADLNGDEEDLDDDENFSQKVDEREEYDLVGINIEEFPLDLSTCILKAFACLFLFESCSMNLTDLFLTFKSPKDMFAFQVAEFGYMNRDPTAVQSLHPLIELQIGVFIKILACNDN